MGTFTRMMTRQLSDVKEGHKSLAFVSIAGDLVHNFVDGALIGVVFTKSIKTGWVTTLAILLHEIPQELGEFAILMQSGYSTWKALAVNFGVSLSCLLGTIIAIPLGQEFATSTTYALTFAGGLFLYLALTGIVPQILESKGCLHGTLTMVIFIVGIGLMALTMLTPHSHS